MTAKDERKSLGRESIGVLFAALELEQITSIEESRDLMIGGLCSLPDTEYHESTPPARCSGVSDEVGLKIARSSESRRRSCQCTEALAGALSLC
jgi:hypothetical protein